jgi:hypothetical protein
MKTLFRGVIDLVEEKSNIFSFILNKKEFQKYFETIKGFTKVNVERKETFQFDAINILTLSQLLKKEKELSYLMCESIFIDVVQQIKTLEEMGYGYLSIHPDDLIFIQTDDNNFCFIFLNLDDPYEVEKNILKITKPYSKHSYFSPEIKNNTIMPTNINYSQNIFYSLALIICNCLNLFDSKGKYIDYKNRLDCILETKLYWALLRCLQDKPDDRFCLFI